MRCHISGPKDSAFIELFPSGLAILAPWAIVEQQTWKEVTRLGLNAENENHDLQLSQIKIRAVSGTGRETTRV
jgi:hypothetical protein